MCLLSCLFFFFVVLFFSREERKRQTKRHTTQKKHTRIFLFKVTHTHIHTHTKKGQKRGCFLAYAFFLFRCRHRHREEIVTHCFDIIVVSRRARGVSRLLTTTTCLCTNAETKKKETAVATNESSGVLSLGVGRTLFTPQTVRIPKKTFRRPSLRFSFSNFTSRQMRL